MQIPKKQVRNHAKSFFYIRIRGTFKISLARPATTAIALMLFYILISVKVRYIYTYVCWRWLLSKLVLSSGTFESNYHGKRKFYLDARLVADKNKKKTVTHKSLEI